MALAGGRLTGEPQPVPFDYLLYRTAQRMGIPPWVLEGYPIDQPPVEWVERVLEFSRLENSVRVSRR